MIIPYEIIKNNNLVLESDSEFKKSNIDIFKETFKDNIKNEDLLSRYIEKLDLLSMNNGTLSEQCTSDILLDNIFNESDISLPQYTPWFTQDEFEMIYPDTNYNAFYNNYVIESDGVYDYSKYINEVRNMYYDINKNDDALLRIGWNPSVEPTDKNFQFARERISHWVNEKTDIKIIDISNIKGIHESANDPNDILQPIYIVLSFVKSPFGDLISKWTHSDWSHSSLSLDPTLTKMYTYNISAKYNGFAYESLSQYTNDAIHHGLDDAKIMVMGLFVTKDQKNKLQEILNYFSSNISKTRYGMKNIANIVLNRSIDTSKSLKLVCSQFVDFILKSINIDLTHLSSNLVSPSTIAKSNDKRLFILFNGNAKDYKPKQAERRMIMLKHNINVTKYLVGNISEFVTYYYKNKDIKILTETTIRYSNDEINKTLNDIYDLLTAKPIFEFKINLFNKDGDFVVDLPKSLELQYQNAHKLLIEYDKVNNYDGMKDELCLLWSLNNNIEKRINKKNNKELLDLRARVLNDFKKYINILLLKNPDFKFSEYYKDSPYYDGRIEIDNSTLKWSGKIIKSIIV